MHNPTLPWSACVCWAPQTCCRCKLGFWVLGGVIPLMTNGGLRFSVCSLVAAIWKLHMQNWVHVLGK